MKSFLIIGAGRFGKHLAKKLIELGNDVVAVDKNAEKIGANIVCPRNVCRYVHKVLLTHNCYGKSWHLVWRHHRKDPLRKGRI